MLKKMRSVVLLFITILCFAVSASAQDDVQTFRTFQFNSTRVSQAFTQYNDSLKRMFEAVGLKYPCSNIYIRNFKSSNEMELWGRNNDTAEYRLVKLYHICALSGVLGPKRGEGDRQVPEGLYFIDDFNPRSDFYLSMLINYPNFADKSYTRDSIKLGGNIYIHGGCVTVGCIPMTDPVIQEIYTLCMNAKLAGQNYVPVHIYPIRFDRKGLNFLGREYANDAEKQRFWVNLKGDYDYFEKNHKLEPVMYTPDGKYYF